MTGHDLGFSSDLIAVGWGATVVFLLILVGILAWKVGFSRGSNQAKTTSGQVCQALLRYSSRLKTISARLTQTNADVNVIVRGIDRGADKLPEAPSAGYEASDESSHENGSPNRD